MTNTESNEMRHPQVFRKLQLNNVVYPFTDSDRLLYHYPFVDGQGFLMSFHAFTSCCRRPDQPDLPVLL